MAPERAADDPPISISVPESQLEDLRQRLRETRWPDSETVDDWSQGVPLAYLRELCDYWRDGYDWRRVESRLNSIEGRRDEIDGVDLHYLRAGAEREGAPPLLLLHGWPGSVVEFLDVLGPLSRPSEFGGRAEDAFEVICPSLPGYGFSGPAPATGYGTGRIGAMFVELMSRLGHDRFIAQGGDWGAIIAAQIAVDRPERLLALHTNMPLVSRRHIEAAGEPTAAESRQLDGYAAFAREGRGYSILQATRPQTLGYGLADSPAGQAAWVLEKFQAWSDSEEGGLERLFGRDRLLDNVMTYWLPNRGASSARLYWESYRDRDLSDIAVPTGCSIFPREIFPMSRRWVEARFSPLVYWNEIDRGGHFAAMEQPALFVDELRAFRRALGPA